MKELTIIIPSYNTVSFIHKNMATFIDERLFEKVEILLINDGSKDNTAELAMKYEEDYAGYVRCINKENGGHGSVINRGIQEAQGKYIKVIDADDWVDTDNLIRMVELLCVTDADVVINPYIKIHQQTGEKLLCGTIDNVNGSTFEFNKLVKENYKIVLHSGTYKTELFREHGIKVTEKCFYEDFQYTLYPIPYINTVIYNENPVYYYLVGQKTQSVNATSGLKNMDMYIKVYRDAIGYFESIESSTDANIREYMSNCLSDYLRSMYNIYLRNYKKKNIEKKLLESDIAVKEISSEIYEVTGRKNLYIKLLRSGNPLILKLIGLIFSIYKRKEIS